MDFVYFRGIRTFFRPSSCTCCRASFRGWMLWSSLTFSCTPTVLPALCIEFCLCFTFCQGSVSAVRSLRKLSLFGWFFLNILCALGITFQYLSIQKYIRFPCCVRYYNCSTGGKVLFPNKLGGLRDTINSDVEHFCRC